jgi:hypothetical protein
VFTDNIRYLVDINYKIIFVALSFEPYHQNEYKMKIASIFFYLGVLLSMLFSSCNSTSSRADNTYDGQQYGLNSFDRIKLSGAYVVDIVQGEEASLTVKASERDHRETRAWVEDGMLYVKSRNKNLSTKEIKLEISVKELKRLWVEGGVNLATVGYLELDSLDLLFQGGANVNFKTKANIVKVKAEGGVNIVLEGVANELIAITEGAGNIDADQLQVKIATCRVSGIGNATVYATEELNATIEGIGRIGYRGEPVVTKQVSGLGVVHRR